MFRFWFFLSTVCFLNAVVVERIVASFFVADYEKKPRIWLSTAVNGVSLSTSLLMTITFMLRLYPICIFIPAIGVIVLLYLLAALLIYLHNRSRLRILHGGTPAESSSYTLSVKFQVVENLRVMKIVVAVFCYTGALMVFCLILLIVTFEVFGDLPYTLLLFFAVYDLLIASSVTILCAIGIFILGECRWHFRDFPFMHRILVRCGLPNLNESGCNRVDPQNISKQYFEQLKKAWDI
ncbi:hypothetical protein Aduo_004088 [Ancylostoma duodenale]